jgi:molybdate transport system substrate-binding protein
MVIYDGASDEGREGGMFGRNAGLLGAGLTLFTLLACSKAPRPGEGPVRVLVAASTKEAVEEVAALFTQESGVEVVVVPEASSKLAMQIVNGAPADLFLSANDKWADFIKGKGLAYDTRPLLTNRLVLIVPRGNPASVRKPPDLAGSSVGHVALAGPAVPAGAYARQALKKLGLLGDLERGKKIVSGEDVRATLTFVERGEAEAGVVYDTDARITDKVEVVYTFSPSTHEPILYPLVLLEAGQKKEVARKLFEFLQSPRAAAVFAKHGFTPLRGK